MKTAYEIAMEKLRKQDAERGEELASLTDDQKREIAEIRSTFQAKLAEREILHKDSLKNAAGDVAAIQEIERGYREDRARLERQMEERVLAVRSRQS